MKKHIYETIILQKSNKWSLILKSILHMEEIVRQIHKSLCIEILLKYSVAHLWNI